MSSMSGIIRSGSSIISILALYMSLQKSCEPKSLSAMRHRLSPLLTIYVLSATPSPVTLSMSSVLMEPSVPMVSRPMAWSFVPACSTGTALPSLFLNSFAYCSWLWPSIMASMPLVPAITASEVHFSVIPAFPRCPTSITYSAPSALASSAADCTAS